MKKAEKQIIEITLDEWVSQGESLFGTKKRDWIFVCPICKKEQSANDFIKLGVDVDKGYVGFSCIGRFKKGAYKTFGKNESGASAKNGCDYTSGGVFVLNEKFIILEDGKKTPCFKFKGEL